MTDNVDPSTESTIAIVGMSGRFPGAPDVATYWHNLRDGIESISVFSEDELEQSGVARKVFEDPSYVRANGCLENVELFDADFFGINPREAEVMDPQHRLFLETAWEALESAGYDSERYDGRIGVFAGVGVNSYAMANLMSRGDFGRFVGALQASIRNRTDHLTTHVCYKLNLRGPGVTVQTACSTSLVAVHLASQSLLNGECDMALAGGVSITVPQKTGYVSQEGGILSPDGHCRAFDANAGGTVPGSGVGLVVLKRLEDAIADRDEVLALIRGSAINNDGSQKVGYTAPGLDGQVEVVAEALAIANVAPDTISYIEAHGTGTNLGDPIEIEALQRVYKASTQRRGFCAIGSVKTNIGHLDVAAGVAGLIKVVQALRYGQIPPSLHYEKPNPQIDFANSPFYVNRELAQWSNGATPLRAGVSSFGIGGTNAHVVLEVAPPVRAASTSRPWQLLTLSAKSKQALEAATANLAQHLERHPELALADVASTLQTGRRAFEYRRAVVCRPDHAVTALQTLDPNYVYTGITEPRARPIVFMFPGQGSQHVNMGRELYDIEPTFKTHVDRCCELLQTELGLDLRDVLYPDESRIDWANDQLQQTYLTQPALFVIEYALAKLWMQWGLTPESMIGHSIGEYVAACLAGVLSLEDALRLVAVRGRLMQALPTGGMMVVPLPEHDVAPLLNDDLSLAAVNGPSLCVVSGRIAALDALERELAGKDLACRRLRTSHAFHSHMMEPMLAEFRAELEKVTLSPPQHRYLSNVTGAWIEPQDATSPEYWVSHIRNAVRFNDGVRELIRNPDAILLEVGPGRGLMTIARWHPDRAAGQLVLTSMPHMHEGRLVTTDSEAILGSLGRLWLAGVGVDWAGFSAHEQRRRVPLPTYPFQRRRYWIEGAASSAADTLSLAKQHDISDWFYAPSWKRVAPQSAVATKTQANVAWLLLASQNHFHAQIADWLEKHGQAVTLVEPGEQFARISASRFAVRPTATEDYEALFAELATRKLMPQRIVHLWNLAGADTELLGVQQGFYAMTALSRALGSRTLEEPVHIDVVTDNMQEIVGGELKWPEKATVLGPCRAIPREYEALSCRSIDVDLAAIGARPQHDIAAQVGRELLAWPAQTETVVAYRGGYRWVQGFEPVPLRDTGEPNPRLRSGGVYLITGGLGGIGLEIAELLGRSVAARLALIGRRDFPKRSAWKDWLASHEAADPTAIKIRRLQALEDQGARVLVVSADVADEEQMRNVMRVVQQELGELNGIVHCAGVSGGGLIQLTSPEQYADVLAPKVDGTRVLEKLTREKPLDFFALCSSRAAILGGFGQADYCAANAFLDAFAHYHNAASSTPTVSINWAGWQQVGMRVDTLSELGLLERPAAEVEERIGHPLLHKRIERTADREVFSTDFSVATHWVLDDHRIARQPILPGTTYLEIVRAALESRSEGATIELRDVYFLNVIPVREDETKEVRTIIEGTGPDFDFRVTSLADVGGQQVWQDYVIGKASIVPSEGKRQHNIAALIAKCKKKEVVIADDDPIVTYEDLGPRWLSLKKVYVGENELVALLELPQEFTDDVSTYKLHPALLDRANFTAKVFLAFEGLHLPMGYKALHIKHGLPARVYAYAKYKPNDDPLFETITFDVILMDENGVELVVVDEFSQKRVRDPAESIKAAAASSARTSVGRQIRPAEPVAAAEPADETDANDGTMTPQEGVEVFRRILSSAPVAQIVVSPNDLGAAIAQADRLREQTIEQESDKAAPAGPRHSRPDLQSEYVAPRDELETQLAEIWAETLGIEPIGIDDNFFDLGGDSVVGIQMVARFKKQGFALSPQQLFQNQTIRELSAVLGDAETVTADQGVVSGPVPLVPSQLRLFEQHAAAPVQHNEAMRLELKSALPPQIIERAIHALLLHHDALRLRFAEQQDQWTQLNADAIGPGAFSHVSLSAITPDHRLQAFERIVGEAHASLDLAAGPLVRFILVELDPSAAAQLLIIAHELVIDSVSWWILLSDLDTACDQARRGTDIALPPKTTSFKEWAESLAQYAAGDQAREEAKYWLSRSPTYPLELPLATQARNAAADHRAALAQVTVALTDAQTRDLLQEGVQRYRAVVNDFVVTALVETLSPARSRDGIVIEMEDHGRETLAPSQDLSRTVGSLRSVYPVLLTLDSRGDPGQALKSIKEQLRAVPRGGLSYGALRYGNGNGSAEPGPALRSWPKAAVRFSYLGHIDHLLSESELFRLAEIPIAPICSSGVERPCRFEVRGSIADGRLHVDWRYDPAADEPRKVERLASGFLERLRALIEHCKSPGAGGYTPSDFPLAEVSQDQLDRIAAKLIS